MKLDYDAQNRFCRVDSGEPYGPDVVAVPLIGGLWVMLDEKTRKCVGVDFDVDDLEVYALRRLDRYKRRTVTAPSPPTGEKE